MIEAIVVVLVAGFSMAIGAKIGSRTATEKILARIDSEYDKAVSQDLINEFLENPNTKEKFAVVLRDYMAGRRSPFTGKIYDETPEYDYPYKGINDTGMYRLNTEDWKQRYKPSSVTDHFWSYVDDEGNEYMISDEKYQKLREEQGLEPLSIEDWFNGTSK